MTNQSKFNLRGQFKVFRPKHYPEEASYATQSKPIVPLDFSNLLKVFRCGTIITGPLIHILRVSESVENLQCCRRWNMVKDVSVSDLASLHEEEAGQP